MAFGLAVAGARHEAGTIANFRQAPGRCRAVRAAAKRADLPKSPLARDS